MVVMREGNLTLTVIRGGYLTIEVREGCAGKSRILLTGSSASQMYDVWEKMANKARKEEMTCA